MARSPLARWLQSAASVASEAAERHIAIDQVLEERARKGDEPDPERISRRELIRRAGGLGVATVGATVLGGWASAAAAPEPRIAVVGAGLAGLTAAYRLRQAGLSPTVYEASDRLGGRCWTIRGTFTDGQIAEHGGELIDTGHIEIRQLAKELGLVEDNLFQGEAKGTEPFYHFDGAPYTYKQATEDLKGIWQKLHADVSAASYPTTYFLSTERGRELDRMSIIDWINESVPGGIESRLGQLLDIAYNIEFGAESDQQSCLNMLYLLGYIGQGKLRIFGPSDEKRHVRGGNDQIVQRLADRIGHGRIVPGTALVAIRQNGTGTFTLTFEDGSRRWEVTADKVVMAIPFSILREKVDYAGAGFRPVKVTAIEELGMGTNSKLHVQFTDRHWSGLGCNGDTVADTGYQNTWEVSRAQPGRSGILVDYTGGDVGASMNRGTPAQRARTFLQQLEPVLPGISAKWNDRVTLDYWTSYPWTLGSYSFYKIGQYQRFGAAEGEREGNCHFAGEHTTQDFQGWLQGAVFTGGRAATEILGDLKKA
jgi:monoamine oxidase